MDFLVEGFREAWRLIVSGDEEVLHAIFVTLVCSFAAVTLAALIAFPYGAWLGIRRRRAQGVQVFLMRVGMFAPTVVIGLIVYSLLTRRGVLGHLDVQGHGGTVPADRFTGRRAVDDRLADGLPAERVVSCAAASQGPTSAGMSVRPRGCREGPAGGRGRRRANRTVRTHGRSLT